MMKDQASLVNRRCAFVCSAGILVVTITSFTINLPVLAVQALQPVPSLTAHRNVWDSIPSERQYFAALHAADSTAFQKEFEAELLLLLNKTLRQSYDSLTTIAQRKAFIEYYWKASNPAPLLPLNLRLREHLRRREFARQNFSAPAPPYFDDRGKYYLRYGEPVNRFEDPGGLRRVGFFSSANYRAIQSQYSYKGGPEEHYTVSANESWAYPNIARDFVIHFVKAGPTFREIESLTEVLASQQKKNLPWQWSDLIKQRAAISPFLGQAAQQIEKFESAVIAASTNPNRPGLLRADVQSLSERLLEVARSNDVAADKVRRDLPANGYESVSAANQLAFQNHLAQFRGANGHTRVEITFLAPFPKNFMDRLDSLAHDTIAVEFAWMLRDENLDSLAAKRWENTFPAQWAALENLPNAVGRLSFLAPPQTAELALQMRLDRLGDGLGDRLGDKLSNGLNNKLGYLKRGLAIRDFSGRELMLSDLQFYAEVKTEKQSRMLPVTEKQNLLLAPYPYLKIHKSAPLLCYFEVYNLRSAGITGNYEITYKIVSERTSQSFFKKISKWLGGGKETAVSLSHAQPVIDEATQELIGIDVSNVAAGAHRLEITVTSATDGRIKASAAREIIVEEQE